MTATQERGGWTAPPASSRIVSKRTRATFLPTAETLSVGELRAIDRVTVPHLFRLDGIAQVQQGDWLLSLAPTARGTTP